MLDEYLITIDDDYANGENLGISKIGYVNSPAVIVKGMAYKSDTPKQMLFSNNVKMRIAAPVLIPMTIYRYDDEEDYEYNVKFTAEVIEQIYSKFMKNLANQNIFNLEHKEDEIVPAYILETILCDSDAKIKMIKDEYNIDIPKGSVFMVTQVTDQQYYNDLVANERCAYSIEGFLGMEYISTKMSEMKNKNKNKEEKMEDNSLKLPTGEHTIGDKIYVIDADGKLAEIKDVVKTDAPVEEIKAEDVKPVEEVAPVEEVKAEDVKPVEEVKPEEKVAMAIDETELMTILQPKLDEIYAMIAEVKSQLASKEDVEVEDITSVEPVAMSAIEKRLNFAKSFIK